MRDRLWGVLILTLLLAAAGAAAGAIGSAGAAGTASATAGAAGTASAPGRAGTASATPGRAGTASITAAGPRASSATVWLCRPGLADDPCTSSLATTDVTASGIRATVTPRPTKSTAFDCFYAYPTVSQQPGPNATLKVGQAEIDAAISQASRFSQVCQVYAPIYRQVTLPYLAVHPGLDFPASVNATAYASIESGFEDFLDHYDGGRPFVVIGHSQGAAMLILLLRRLVDDVPTLRQRLLLAIIAGGNVEVPVDRLVGASFQHIPVCNRSAQTDCVIAYSSFPSTPPADALFGRPGQGVSLQSGQTARTGLQVACADPAGLATGSGTLDPFLLSDGAVKTLWVSYPDLYASRCEHADGASWLEVSKATGRSDQRPLVSEVAGPAWGYHTEDLNLALGNLVNDVAYAETTWADDHRR